MNRIEQNGTGVAKALEKSDEGDVNSAPPVVNVKGSFVPRKQKLAVSFKDNGRVLFIGAGIVLVLLVLALGGVSRRSQPTRKSPAINGSQRLTQVQNGGSVRASVTPIMDTGHAADQNTDGDRISPDQIARTVTKQAKQEVPASLRGVRSFDNQQLWQPPAFQNGSQAVASFEKNAAEPERIGAKNENDAMEKASLVFVRNNPSSNSARPQDTTPILEWGVGLAPGTTLRARLESAVSTAVRTPVVAVIEYNYEQKGEIVVPAGAKAFGHLESADRSGYIGIRFESLMMPDGSSVNLDAAATDLQLRPLRGKVEGKHTGKNILLRSVAGVGEIGSALVGRGSLNQPLSESDLLREKVSNNIGQASDQTLANLAITERVVISLSASTEIYVVLQKPAKNVIQSAGSLQPTHADSLHSIDELRQLMQLQRELNQTEAVNPSQE